MSVLDGSQSLDGFCNFCGDKDCGQECHSPFVGKKISGTKCVISHVIRDTNCILNDISLSINSLFLEEPITSLQCREWTKILDLKNVCYAVTKVKNKKNKHLGYLIFIDQKRFYNISSETIVSEDDEDDK